MAACVRSRRKFRQQAKFARCFRAGVGPSPVFVRASSSRIALRRSPRSCRISAAKHFSSRSSPSSRCSVPICLWLGVPPLPPHRRAPACIRSLREDRPTWKPFPESWCVPRSASGSIPPTHATAKSGLSTPCPHAIDPATSAPSRCKVSRTGWPHTGQRRLPAGFFRIAFEHVTSPQMPSVTSAECISLFSWYEPPYFQEEALRTGPIFPERLPALPDNPTVSLSDRKVSKPKCPSPALLLF